ncbi:hypothetical protein [Ktedonospora formicarum]|uniref:Uncharacterized protein n=1 Tax=Ktedonospora formicarum TaxID=2778364 RepID=A0A8J3IEE0_9CHLR|nr:hypothetical protein [Ktedonospora formicarum]GHO50823.1 hypothetical protein KSX_89860 [Ktedonospora formicarum]
MHASYNETTTPSPLPYWATLTQVSQATGVSRSAVRSVARRALKQEEPWVKKEDGRILLNTHHDTYTSHARRWQEDTWSTTFLDDLDTEDQDKQFTTSNTQNSFYWYPSLATEGYTHWPQFCQWLASQGLYVTLNLLVGEEILHWTWGEHQGTVQSASVRDAVIAALTHKLTSSPAPASTEVLPPASTPPSSSEETPHFWPFKRNKITNVLK